MPPSEYDKAIAGLTADIKRAIEDVLNNWSTDAELSQVKQNIACETGLGQVDFTSLLNSFAAQLAGGNSPLDSWLAACRAHKRRGRPIPYGDCPATLGRAKGLEDHATSVARTSGGSLTSTEVKKLLLKYSGQSVPSGLETFLRETPLGKFNLVWGTFDLANPAANPFDKIPNSRVEICTALGLGDFTDSLIILVWSHFDAGSPKLHRPTVADAEVYRFYRPNPDINALWGLTAPLMPNPSGLEPRPEVVMADPTSRGLRLPFIVVPA